MDFDYDDVRQEGYEEGLDVGREEGHKEGYSEGVEDGRDLGKDELQSEAVVIVERLKKGCTTGTSLEDLADDIIYEIERL